MSACRTVPSPHARPYRLIRPASGVGQGHDVVSARRAAACRPVASAPDVGPGHSVVSARQAAACPLVASARGRDLARARGVRRHHEAGQASVELVAFLPLLLLIALAVFSFAAAQAAREEAGAAAEAAALALLQGRDAREAAEAALPAASRSRARIDVSGASVRVHLRPRLPLLADRLSASEEAHAGP